MLLPIINLMPDLDRKVNEACQFIGECSIRSSFLSLLHSVFKLNIDNEFYTGKTVYSLCCNKSLTPELTFNLTVAI